MSATSPYISRFVHLEVHQNLHYAVPKNQTMDALYSRHSEKGRKARGPNDAKRIGKERKKERNKGHAGGKNAAVLQNRQQIEKWVVNSYSDQW